MVPKALSAWKKSDWTRAREIASDMPMGDDPQTYMIGSVYVDVGRDGRGGFVGVNSFDSRGRDLRYRRVYIEDMLSRRKRNGSKTSAKKWSFKIQKNPFSGEPEAVATDGWATSYGSLAHSYFDGNYVAWGGSTVPPKYISRAVLVRLLRMSEETTAQRTPKFNGAKRSRHPSNSELLAPIERRELRWITPRSLQGQIVETSFAGHANGVYSKIHDRSSGDIVYGFRAWREDDEEAPGLNREPGGRFRTIGRKPASAKHNGRKPSFVVYHTHNGHIVSRHRSEGAAMDARDREARRLSRWRNASHGGNRNAMVGVAVRVE